MVLHRDVWDRCRLPNRVMRTRTRISGDRRTGIELVHSHLELVALGSTSTAASHHLQFHQGPNLSRTEPPVCALNRII